MRLSVVMMAIVVMGNQFMSASAQLSSSLVRYYKMDESSKAAEAVDEIDTANNLKVNDSARKSLPSSGAMGQMGNAWDFEKNPTTTVGDYDGSGGPVNGADFLVWQRNFGTTNVMPSDPTPEAVDGSDLINWQSNYGLESNDTPLLDNEGFPLAQFLDEGNSIWDGTATNGVFFSIWVKPESLNTGIGEESRNVIISEDSDTQDFYVRSTEGGKIEMALEGIGEVITDSVVLAVDQWTHISGGLIVDDGFEFTNTLVLYANGVQVGFNDFAATNTPDSVNDLILGTQDDSADDVSSDDPLAGYFARTSWDGLMDDAAFWTRALSESEVQDIYNRGLLGLGLLETPQLAASAAVPEPTSLILMGLAASAVVFRRRQNTAARS